MWEANGTTRTDEFGRDVGHMKMVVGRGLTRDPELAQGDPIFG